MCILPLAGWLLVACARAAVAAAGVVEVDLVFPRNETYAPTPLLPIIFALQNAELARVLNPRISFEVWDWVNRSETAVTTSYDLQYANLSSSDPYFAYRAFTVFDSEGLWRLTWRVAWDNCTEDSLSDSGNPYPLYSNEQGNSLIFATKNGSQEVDLVAASASQSCSSEDTGGTGPAINITDTLAVPARVDWDGGETCAVVASTTATPSPCQVHIDSAGAASISSSMTAQVCSIASLTALPISCPADENENTAAQSMAVGGLACLAAALGSLGYYMLV